MRTLCASALLMVSIGLAGCGPEGPSKADTGMVVGAVAGGILGNQVGKGSGNIAATAIGAVVGGIVGSEIGRSLDEQDRRYAQEAEFDALERGQSGVSRQWRNPENGRYGEVVPSRPYKRGQLDCRDYTHKIYIDGRPQAMRGTAGRKPAGTWSTGAGRPANRTQCAPGLPLQCGRPGSFFMARDGKDRRETAKPAAFGQAPLVSGGPHPYEPDEIEVF